MHILLTRYNIDFHVAHERGVDPLGAKYLNHRGELFRHFCVPSVKAQTSRDFEWFVMFDPATPEEHFDFLDGIATVILAKTLDNAWSQIKRRLPLFSPIICSRMDNDDCIAPEFIAATRKTANMALAEQAGDFVVTPQIGAVASLAEGVWRHRESKSPEFISLVHRRRPWKRCISVLHLDHRTHGGLPLVPINQKGPLWLALLHEQNLQRRWEANPEKDRSLDDPPSGFDFVASETLEDGWPSG